MKPIKSFFIFLYEHLEYIFIVIIFGGVLYLAFANGSLKKPYASPMDDPDYYANKIFDDSRVHRIDINIASSDYANLLTEPGEKTKYHASVNVDGEVFPDVGISTRGNVSLYIVADEDMGDRYSFKLNFQKFGSERYHGLDKLLLNNLYSDPSYLEDATTYAIMRAVGVAAPLTSFTELYINGELKGLYVAIEDVDKSFLSRNHFPPDAVLYKPEATAIDHFRLKDISRETPEGIDPNIVLDPSQPDFDYGGADLVYTDDDAASYPAIFDNAVSKIAPEDREYLLRALKSLSPVSTESPSNFWDKKALARYFAANNFVLNFDNYIGITSHNYYLLSSRSTGNTFLPWDYNLAFEGIWFDEEESHVDSVLNWPIDDPLSIENEESRPVWQYIKDDPYNLELYHTALQNLLDNYFFSGECDAKIASTADLIRPYVYSDPTRFYSIDEFESNINLLRTFVAVRADFIQKQLWGLEPREKGDKLLDDERDEFLRLNVTVDN